LELKGAAEELGMTDQVIFTGARSDIPAMMRAIDLLVLNSKVEPLGLVVLEAMACGTPVVATAVDGVPELIAHKATGWLVPSGHERQLVEGIVTLAVMGGIPAFDEEVYVGRPNLGDKGRLLDWIEKVLESGWLTNNGRYLREFERRIAEIAGVKHCVAVCNATVGLEIVIRALGLRGEVILPSFTFAATAHALQWQGITPVFATWIRQRIRLTRAIQLVRIHA